MLSSVPVVVTHKSDRQCRPELSELTLGKEVESSHQPPFVIVQIAGIVSVQPTCMKSTDHSFRTRAPWLSGSGVSGTLTTPTVCSVEAVAGPGDAEYVGPIRELKGLPRLERGVWDALGAAVLDLGRGRARGSWILARTQSHRWFEADLGLSLTFGQGRSDTGCRCWHQDTCLPG